MRPFGGILLHKTSLSLALWSLFSSSFPAGMPWLGAQAGNSSGYRRELPFAVDQRKVGFNNFGGQNLLVRAKAGTY